MEVTDTCGTDVTEGVDVGVGVTLIDGVNPVYSVPLHNRPVTDSETL